MSIPSSSSVWRWLLLVSACVAMTTRSLVHARALSTGISRLAEPRVVMVFDNRTVYDGETVTVGVARDETRKEVLVECVVRGQVPDHAVLASPFYAMNANLLDVRTDAECAATNARRREGDLASCKRIALEAGGFLKLQCVLTHPNVTGPLASVMANFTLLQTSETTTAKAVSETTPVVSVVDMNLYPHRQSSPMSKNAQLDSGSSRSTQHVFSTFLTLVLCVLLNMCLK